MPARPSKDDILSAVRDLGYVQWDPVSIVAPSHILSLWCRLGDFQPSDLDRLLWDDRTLFLHWTPMASIVPMEDYSFFNSLMRRYPQSLSGSWGSHELKARKFLAEHVGLRRSVLEQLKRRPLTGGEFDEHPKTKKRAEDWAPTSDVNEMLFHLLMLGKVMVVGHRGTQNVWGLSEEFLPAWVEKGFLRGEDFELEAAQRAIRALGTATPSEINYYFVRGRYRNLKKALARLEKDSAIRRIVVDQLGGREERYIHAKDVPLIDSVASGWRPRVSLLPPFDNLICSTARTQKVFGFEYVREQFLPKEKRRYGTYVLPILWGDRLIGRIDPQLDRKNGSLLVHSVHAEPGAPEDRETASKIAEKIGQLAKFLGAKKVDFSGPVPAPWKSSLR